MLLNPTVTEVGQQAAFNASSTGTELVITDISFGIGSYDPVGDEEALVNEVVKVPVASGSRITPTQIRMNGVWNDDAASSPISEVGIWAGSTLFAVWSRATGGPLGYKSQGVDFVFNYSMLLTVVPPGSVTVLEDSGQSAVLAALMAHEGGANPHPQYMKRIRRIWTGEAGGTVDALVLTPSAPDVFESFEEGQGFVFVASGNNTGAVTVEVTDVDTLPLKKNGSLALDANDLLAGGVYEAIYDGTNLQLVSGGGGGGAGGQTFDTEVFTATEGQTTFAATYTPGNIMVIVGGRQISPNDYTADNGTSVVFDTGLNAGDEVLVIGFSSFSVANVVNLTDAQTVNGVKTFTSSPIVPTVSSSDSTQKVASTAQVQAAITARIASTAAAGISRLANNTTDVAAVGTGGGAADIALTPAALAAVTANSTQRGLVELATNAETQSGASASLAVTPAGLASRTATEARTGIAAVATTAQVKAGADDATMLTPLKLRQEVGVNRLIGSGSISGASLELILSTLDPTQAPGNRYRLILSGYQPATNDVELQAVFSSNAGSSYVATGYYSAVRTADSGGGATLLVANNGAAAKIVGDSPASASLSNTAGELAYTEIEFMAFNTGVSVKPMLSVRSRYWESSGTLNSQIGDASNNAAADYDAIKLSFESGNFAASGTYELYKIG